MDVTVFHEAGVETVYNGVKRYDITDAGLLRLKYADGNELVISPHAYRSVELPKRTGVAPVGRIL